MSSSPPAVPKPASPGPSKTALIITRSAYVNIRNGPGTQYLDIGDILNNTVVTYYPSTQTGDGWVWLEQRNLSGWIASYVVTFEELNAPPPVSSKEPTPYDGAVAIWHWKGDVVPENSIDDLARNIKLSAPHVTDLFVKTSDYTPSSGARWQGQWDTKRTLAIDGPDSIDRWVQVLGRYGLGFHAWCVPRGLDVAGETNLIIQACQRPGVKSMILDIEPYEGFWSAGRAGIRPFMTAIRRAVPGSFHIGMSVDPRSHHYASIFPDEWFPFVNSIHPQTYWTTFRVTPEHALAEVYRVWAGFGKPIIPVLQGDSPAAEMSTGHTLSVQKHQAPGVGWWRLGVISAVGWRSINQPITPGAPPPDPGTEVPPSQYGDEFVIRPGQTGFANGSYTGQQEFRTFLGTWGWDVYYKNTEARQSKVWAQWTPSLKRSGKYEVATFVPNRRATTARARYKIHGVVGATGEMVVEVDQSRHKNQWVTLGVFDFDRNAPNGGSIFLNDLTYEDDKSIAFDAIRWREIVSTGGGGQPGPGGYVADGYDSPIGTLAERRSTAVWPGRWYDASPFGRLYFIGTPNEAYHTGADLNLPADADAHSPVYASASGVVTFASRLPTWGNVVVIRHDPLATNGRVLYSRSAHVESMLVRVGQRVSRGERIASVGNAFGQWAYHLHFDLSPTTILESQPQHWPARNQSALLQNYIDPKAFILANRPR